tara:strand:+ start:880 stop:1035 length:156 start_codon:yes stop_codon:yes gene_type:complete
MLIHIQPDEEEEIRRQMRENAEILKQRILAHKEEFLAEDTGEEVERKPDLI